jgi:long-chain acyl-CoA synthetase
MSTSLMECIYESLSSWGRHPVYIEYTSGVTLSLSAFEVRDRINDAARLMEGWKVRQGHLVFLFLDSTTDVPILFFALHRLGAIPVPLSRDYRSLELDEIFSSAQPQVIICEKQHTATIAKYLQGRIVIERDYGRLNLLQKPERLQEPDALEPDIGAILYTYRGYGFPLGALIPNIQLLHGARVLQEGLQGNAGERMLVILPPHHIFTIVGCYLVPLLNAMTAVIPDTLNPRILFELIASQHITTITAVPELYALFSRVLDLAGSLDSLQAFVSGGSQLTAESFNTIRAQFNVELMHGYGLTEFAPVSRNIRFQTRPGTMGPICPGVECKILDPDPQGVGEIGIRSEYMFRGYYRRQRQTEEAFRQGWFLTGDLGRMDQGHLIFEQEKKKTRKVNGKIVDLAEVRRGLIRCLNVQEAEVYWQDQALAARVRLNSGILDHGQVLLVKNQLNNLIAAYKVPKVISGY